MKRSIIKSVLARLLLLLATATLAAGCYAVGPPPEYPDYGYYGGYYPGFYGPDVIIGVGGHEERHHDVSHVPDRRIPSPAPRPKPHSHADHEGRR